MIAERCAIIAEALDCHDVLLVYPHPPARPLNTKIGAIRVRTAVFALDDDLDDAGQAFVKQLLNG